MSTAPYTIARTTGHCVSTGKPLAPGDRRVTVLVDDADDPSVLGRLDYSAEAWDAGARPPAGTSVFGMWHNVVPDGTRRDDALLDPSDLLELFSSLEDAETPERVGFRYMLALMLIRKKRLIHEGAEPASETAPAAILVRERGVAPPPERGGDGPRLIRVEEPSLGDEALAAITEQVSAVMRLDG
ncbi:MAG: hypothetical protein AAF235_04565 [Planctomycetota bacterium]